MKNPQKWENTYVYPGFWWFAPWEGPVSVPPGRMIGENTARPAVALDNHPLRGQKLALWAPVGGPQESLRDINILGVRSMERSYHGREPEWKGYRVLASGLPSKANPPRPTDQSRGQLYAELFPPPS